MTRFQVDSEAVLGAHGAIQATMSRIEAEASQLKSQLTDLQSSWSGPAATAFQSVVLEWTATQQRVEQSLSTIGQALGQAGRYYTEVEVANARMFAI
ncbi:MAG: WXG100 family type VII secretion target [Cryobacterium sp.]|nr:WXG100 family type VII secretion target [Cryobacterium sp.]MCO5294692.1 WXG100 family type VII secretion target [Homoserinimonas sp.]